MNLLKISGRRGSSGFLRMQTIASALFSEWLRNIYLFLVRWSCPIVLLFVGFSSPAQTHTLQFDFNISIEDAEQLTALGSVGIEFGNTTVVAK